jgi:YVTN family beta-propeller protein
MPTFRFHMTNLLFLLLALLCLMVGLPGDAGSSAHAGNPANIDGDSAQKGNDRPLTPAGSLVMDATTRQPAVGALPVGFVRSPDKTGPGGRGRYLIAINSGFGVQFNGAANGAEQSLAIIDLMARPAASVVQNVYFPSPQSVSVGAAFAPDAEGDGSYRLYVSGGFENKIWIFHLKPGERLPISPVSAGSDKPIEAPFIDVSGLSAQAPSSGYNDNRAPVYPAGIGISTDGNTLYVANNLGDSAGIVSDLINERRITRIDLRRENKQQFVYPYGLIVASSGGKGDRARADRGGAEKVYVSCWNTESIAVIDPQHTDRPARLIKVGRHPTAMTLNEDATRLYSVNSDGDSVSVIDTASDREIERVSVKLSEDKPAGVSPEGLALSPDGRTLFVANANSNSVAVVQLSAAAAGETSARRTGAAAPEHSKVRGFIPTGMYPSSLAVVGRTLFIGNGKGTGFQNSSLVADSSGRAPNLPNDRFPVKEKEGQGGEYILALLSGNISAVELPDESALAAYTQQVMRNNGLVGNVGTALFKGATPIKHVIYIIKENRTYDQVFGDVERAGGGKPADGDPGIAIFGSGDAARRPGGAEQNVTPNHRALAMRFGLLDRFFVNAEASPDGHNWSTAAFSSDYVDKASRWEYSRRGRTYDYEGFNRLPSYEPPSQLPHFFHLPMTGESMTAFMRRFVPYLNGSRDVAEPETLYLWDAAARAGMTYRNYGEFIGQLSEADLEAINLQKSKVYPDVSPSISAIPTKKSLEGHYCPGFRAFDVWTPDIMTTESYRVSRQAAAMIDPAVTRYNSDERFRGVSRYGAWLEEFRGYVEQLKSTGVDHMPALSTMRLPSDHTNGTRAGMPTPQFYVADNDYAVGRLVQEISKSPYWKDTAIFVVEDDAQAGPDHVDAHRAPALVISAYNRPGELVHEYHNSVSLIRTIEVLLGIAPMNQLDAVAAPIDIFQDTPDLRPYEAIPPIITMDNLMVTRARDAVTASWQKRSAEQDFSHPDMADPEILNRIIWFAALGDKTPMPGPQRLAAVEAMQTQAEREERGPVIARK